nr:hypothetical protein [Chloroflexota bacterium]
MPDSSSEEPVEKIKDAAQQAAKAETTSPPRREYRTILFQVVLFSTIGAFAVLTFMVKTTPSFPIDLQITRGLQSNASPLFSASMGFISWPGFLPQAIVIPALAVLV